MYFQDKMPLNKVKVTQSHVVSERMIGAAMHLYDFLILDTYHWVFKEFGIDEKRLTLIITKMCVNSI